MSTRSIKFQSEQAGPFSEGSIIDINIPASVQMSNMDKSYIQFNSRLTYAEADPTTGIGVHNIAVNAEYPNSIFVRNARLHSSKLGILEEIHHVNIYDANTHAHEVDFSSIKRTIDANYKHDYYKGIKTMPYSSPYQNLKLTGTQASTNNQDVAINISLNRLFPMLKGMKQWSNEKLGDLRITIELDKYLTNGYVPLMEMRDYYANSPAGLSDNLPFANQIVVGPKKVFVTGDDQTSDTLSLWVGQKVNINYKDGPTANQNQVAIIAEIDFVTNAGKATITLDRDVPVANAANKITDALLTTLPIAADSAQMTLDKCAVIVKQLFLNSKQREKANDNMKDMKMPFRTVSLEKKYMAATTHYTNQFDMPSGTVNALILTPALNNVWSVPGNLQRYRLALDGEDTTDRDIQYGGDLEFDRLMNTYTNMDKNIRSLYNAYNDAAYDSAYVIPQPVPLSEKNQQLQIDLYSTIAMAAKNIYVYKEQLKEINFKDGMVSL